MPEVAWNMKTTGADASGNQVIESNKVSNYNLSKREKVVGE